MKASAATHPDAATTDAPTTTSAPAALASLVSNEDFLNQYGPINRNIPVAAPQGWQLEHPEMMAHPDLWDPNFVVNHPPTKFENRDIVVVGGGVGGVMSADQLLDKDFIMLDQNPYLGGNSTGQERNGVSSETGASFINIPTPGDAVDKLLRKIGIADKMVKHKPSDNPVMVKQADGTWKRLTNIWSTGTNSVDKRQFNLIKKYYLLMGTKKKGATPYPQIPFLNDQDRQTVLAADKITARANFQNIVGGPLEPLVDVSLDHWVWSDNAVTIDEASPATVDNFLGVNFGGIVSFPGGNAYILEQTMKHWAQSGINLAERVRPSSLVRDIKVIQDGVQVQYVDAQGVVTQVTAKKVIFAGPKFVGKVVIEGLEPERVAALQNAHYRSFVTAVVRVKLDRPIPREKQFYDMYLLDGAVAKAGAAQARSDMQGATDVIGSFGKQFAEFVFFYPLPYNGARGTLLDPANLDKYKNKIMSQFNEILVPELGLNPANVVDVLMQRRGHPMIATLQGNYGKGVTDVIRAPFKGGFTEDRIYFVNQDNWLLPAFETTLAEAQIQIPALRSSLEKELANGATTVAVPEGARTESKLAALVDRDKLDKLKAAAAAGCPHAIALVSGK